jgi:hypothetical protein
MSFFPALHSVLPALELASPLTAFSQSPTL